MDRIRMLLTRCATLFSKRKLDADLDEELRSHIDLAVEENLEHGMSRQDARTAALRVFGGVTQTREAYKVQRGLPFLETPLQDLRFALRQLRKSPGFAITAILTLSLGMAASIVIFSFVDAALIRPLPYHDSSRLVAIFGKTPDSDRSTFSHADYTDMRRFNTVFSSIAAYDNRRYFILSGATGAEQVNAIAVTGNFFSTLGITPVLGRGFEANEDLTNASATVVLSYAAWQKHFGGTTDVLGKTVTLKGQPYTVIGVLPREFAFAPTGPTEFWMTLHPFIGDECELGRGCHVMSVVARLKDGVTVKLALANTQSIAAQLAQQYPDTNRDQETNIVSLTRVILGDVAPILWALLVGAMLLLVIAYGNVASLLLARSESRRREIAIRGALGAARGRLVRQFITEGLVTVAMSLALCVFAANTCRYLLMKLFPPSLLDYMPYMRGSGWNVHMVAFAAAVALAACALFTAAPMLRIPLANLSSGLGEGGRGSAGTVWRRYGTKLVVLELATTMVLLASAVLLGKSLQNLMHVNVGFVPSHLATLQVTAPAAKYGKNEQAIELQRDVVNTLSSLPGVTAVGAASGLPLGWEGGSWIEIVGKPALGDHIAVGNRQVSAGYLNALQARIIRGRDFNASDSASAPRVVIINQSLAQKYFPNENPIGRQIVFFEKSKEPWRIVGVVADIQEGALDTDKDSCMYRPFEQDPYAGFGVVVRTSQEAASILPTLVAAIARIDAAIATSDAATMPELIQGSYPAFLHRCSAWLAGGFAGLALLLSIIGLYGVIAYSVNQRTREIGVRMALGAQRSSVYKLILMEAGWLTFFGLAAGVVGAVIAGTLLRGMLFNVRSWDVSTLLAVGTMLAASALLASYIPARRAASVNPVEALRAE